MRALVVILLVACVQRSLGDNTRNMTDIIADIFGTNWGSDNNGGLGSNGDSDNEASSETVAEYITPCGVPSDGVGTRSLLIQKRITIDSDNARFKSYPWMVALFNKRTDRPECTLTTKRCWRYTAGGSLINMNVVLTAAHSVRGVKQNHLKARAGDWDLKSKDELFPEQERMVQKIIVHSRFKNSNYANLMEFDAALLVLAKPFNEVENVATICLPQPDLEVSTKCKVAGWGQQRHGSTVGNQNILKVVDLEPMDRDRCQISLTRVTYLEVLIHRSFMCAGGVAEKDSCQGDGGSPLMCINDDYYYQRGIVSWGVGCGEAGVPGVYTDVSKIRDWIDDQMKINGFNPKTYIYVRGTKR